MLKSSTIFTSLPAPPLQSPSTPDLLLYGHTHANGHAFSQQQQSDDAAAEAENNANHMTAATALNASVYSNSNGDLGTLKRPIPVPPPQLFPNGGLVRFSLNISRNLLNNLKSPPQQTQLPPPQPSSTGVMGNVNGFGDDATPHTPLNNPARVCLSRYSFHTLSLSVNSKCKRSSRIH